MSAVDDLRSSYDNHRPHRPALAGLIGKKSPARSGRSMMRPPPPTICNSNTSSGYGGAAEGRPRTSSSWGVLGDAEMRRRKRVAGYKAYAVEGKVKSSLKNSVRWVKTKYSQILHGV